MRISMNKVFSFFYFSVCLLIASPSQGQDYKTDSLEQELAKATIAEVRAELFLELSEKLVYHQPDKSLEYTNEALKVINENKLDYLMPIALNRAGRAYWSLGDLTKSLQYFDSSLVISKQKNEPLIEAHNYAGIGVVYAVAGDKISSIEFYKKALEVFEKEQVNDRIVAMYNNIGRSYNALGQYDSAHYFLDSGLSLIDGNTIHYKANLLFNKAEVFSNQLLYKETKELLEESMNLALQVGDKRIIIRSCQTLAEVELQNGDIKKSLEEARTAWDMARLTGAKELIWFAGNTLAKSLGANGQFKEAHKLFSLSSLYHDSIVDIRVKNKLTLYKYEKEKNELALLIKKSELNDMKLKAHQNYILTLLVAAIMLTIIILIYFKKNIAQRRYNERLSDYNYKLEMQKEEIVEKAEKLDKLNSFKNKNFAILSHDIKNPLMELTCLLNLLEEQDISIQELEELLPEINGRLKNLNHVVDNHLIWAKSQFRDMKSNPTCFNLNELIADQLELLQQTLDEKEISVVSSVSEGLQIYADINHVKIVIRNLLTNAIKFTQRKGTIKLLAEEQSKKVVISVRDNGVGIAEKVIDSLFVKETVSTEGTENEKGSGIGLILCKEIIELNNGKIWVDQVDLGSKFCISLPRTNMALSLN